MSSTNEKKLIKKDNHISKTTVNKQNVDIVGLVEKKMSFFNDVIQKTMLHVQSNKVREIFSMSDVTNCLISLNELNDKLKNMREILDKKEQNKFNNDDLINKLQTINNDLSVIFKNFGTDTLEDFLLVCFGNNIFTNNDLLVDKFSLLKKYFHPTQYKVLLDKKDETNTIISSTSDKPVRRTRQSSKNSDESILEKSANLDCFDQMISSKSFFMRVHGVSIYFNVPSIKKSILVTGVVDDILVHLLDNKFIRSKIIEINENLPSGEEYHNDNFKRFITTMTLKDLLTNDYSSIFAKYAGYLSQTNLIRMKSVSQNVKDFTNNDLFNKRQMLIYLLVVTKSYDNLYLAYLLYDLLTNDVNGSIDTHEQVILMDSFPWVVKEYFRDAMKKTIQYTNDLSNFDINKIPLEQQICLMKVPDSVKEKAMMKLKEVKAKSEDSGSKARQYLDGLLRIPFNIYRKEPILCLMDKIRDDFKMFVEKYKITNIPKREKYTSLEILKCCNSILKPNSQQNISVGDNSIFDKLREIILSGDKNKLIANASIINNILKINNNKEKHIKTTGLNKNQIKNELEKYILYCKDETINEQIRTDTINAFKLSHNNVSQPEGNDNISVLANSCTKEINNIFVDLKTINTYMNDVKLVLDKAVHGHERAKKQVERIVGQWINGEQKGLVLGFEGAPGLGKTTLAKIGLSNILKDDDGVPRPFSMIQLGGDSNGSTLHGHNYTYVGSNWGAIVQILIDKKCMNPIILIDEVDKISRTEHGKEMVGILTHLLDPTQNDCFQDKYFSGIDLDLSKALFVLSYNDVDAIDRILLDRVHRIKFDNLALEDKLVIANKYMLPEIYKTFGLEEIIHFSDDVLKFIIEEYTMESGVRKLKQILNEIVGEINLDVLKERENILDKVLPIEITIDEVKTKYFKDKNEKRIQKIHSESKVGVINALWANSLGQGGVLPLQAKFFPTNKFLELKLTGSLGDVMKESISVSLTTAWNMTSDERKSYLISKYNNSEKNEVYGLHLHCPDCSTPKDGPSATAAFTCVIYSILNDIKIKNTVGITGETSFDHKVTAIGGLDCKILGSLPAGIKEYIYPQENNKDFDRFYEKYKDNKIIEDIKFHSVENMTEVFDVIFE